MYSTVSNLSRDMANIGAIFAVERILMLQRVSKASETEGQKLGTASGVTVNQRSKADLMRNSCTRQPFGDDADHNSEHGCAAIETLSPLQLLEMNVVGRCVLKPVLVGL